MRIVHVTATFPPHYTGTGVVCYHNALGVARLGHNVTVLTADAGDRPGGYTDPEELTVRRLPAWFRFGNAPFLPALWRLPWEGFDLVHLHYPFYFGAESIYARSLTRGLRYVVTYHQDVLFQGMMRWPEGLHHRLLGRRILAGAKRVLATSLDYAGASRLKELMAARPGLVVEMPNGVDARRLHPGLDGERLRASYGLDPAQRLVLFVGALDRAHYFKGMEVLLQALARIPAGDVRLLVVGDGALRPSYQARAAELGVADRVLFCGRVSAEDLPDHYSVCDLLVLPSVTRGEAFGVVLLEAMACGKPVIASNLPGVRSVVSDGQDGLLVQPGDVVDLAAKVHGLLDDAPRRRAMGEQGRAKVEARYDWATIIPRLVRVYEEVLSSAGEQREEK
jgi:glycosyltransferase involved in cell wall biosynthesis